MSSAAAASSSTSSSTSTAESSSSLDASAVVEDQVETTAIPGSKANSRCMLCGEYFFDDRRLQIHREQTHASPEKIVNGNLGCKECGRVFQWERDLQRHQRLHGSQLDDPLEADEELGREDEEDDADRKCAISTDLKQSISKKNHLAAKDSLIQDTNAVNPNGDEHSACLTMDTDWTKDLISDRDTVQEELLEEDAASDPYADHFAALLRLDDMAIVMG